MQDRDKTREQLIDDLRKMRRKMASSEYCEAAQRNINERKHEENILKQSEERYRLLFQNMLEGCAYCKMLFDDKGHPDDWA
ncbi:MAG: hypothetical protein WC647_15675 [Desulfomonilaceae bacterium]|jgi:PAS domain-containing protein